MKTKKTKAVVQDVSVEPIQPQRTDEQIRQAQIDARQARINEGNRAYDMAHSGGYIDSDGEWVPN